MNTRYVDTNSDTDEAVADLLSFLNDLSEKYCLTEIELLGMMEYSKKQIVSVEEDWVHRN